MNTSTEHTGRRAGGAIAAAVLSVMVLLLGCTTAEPATSPGLSATAARASSPAALEAEQDLLVDGHHFKAQCAGQGPSVLLVIGYGGTMEDWGDVPTRLGATARTCMYDRLGVGRSDSPPALQTFEDIATDLDGVISALRLPRPVVVVGHSLGGPIAVTWAAHHEGDARALVLLDPAPPGYRSAESSLLPPPDPGDLELTAMLEAGRRFDDPRTNRESLDPKSWAAYDRITRLDVPLWVLIADQPQQLPAAVDAAKVAAAWKAGQHRLAGLSSDSHLSTAPGADPSSGNDAPTWCCQRSSTHSPPDRTPPAAIVLQLSRHIQVACVAGGLLDHVQDYPAKIGDALIWPVEGTLGQQGRVQVARSS